MQSTLEVERRPRILVYVMEQDDPRKCTSAKLVRIGLARPIRSRHMIPRRAVVLNPLAYAVLLPSDREHIEHGGLVAIDCSWNRSEEIFPSRFPGLNRCLPLLLPGNPVSYGRIGRLSSLEALAASLIITGFSEYGRKLLEIFKWGATFLTLNHAPLTDYGQAKDQNEIRELERAYFDPARTEQQEAKNDQ
jgi:pre-rRNA-processing protein TSR3